jgi:hypothetical protein
MHSHDRLRAELDAWADAGLTASLWWRDDDAVTDTPHLRRLLDIAGEAGVVVGLGVIPEGADESLIELTADGRCCVWQHGWGHHFYEAGEFGEERALELMVHDALLGQQALDGVFGRAGWQRVFVPPNHMLAVPFKSLLPGLGYLGVSAGVPLTPRLAHVVEVNAEVDVMDWPERKLLPESTICDMLVEQLVLRRSGDVPADRPLGVLTHHLVFDHEAWDVTRRLIASLRAHRAVSLVPADGLFVLEGQRSSGSAASSLSTSVRRAATVGVTVVLTSCGRPDLLARTLDSFFAYNTYPIREFVVMEDGEGVSALSDDERYRRHNIRWLSTGRRIGQMPTIDLAYRVVQTQYIFHCEDDWEFYAPGFIERSLAILERQPSILQVWIRALDDTNRHPMTERTYQADGIPYRIVQPGFDSGEWGIWHGFAFNPGLRRRSDAALIDSFADLDPSRTKPSWEIERQASEFYMRRGFLVATLADNDGKGYVRHIGWGRRVGEPTHESR